MGSNPKIVLILLSLCLGYLTADKSENVGSPAGTQKTFNLKYDDVDEFADECDSSDNNSPRCLINVKVKMMNKNPRVENVRPVGSCAGSDCAYQDASHKSSAPKANLLSASNTKTSTRPEYFRDKKGVSSFMPQKSAPEKHDATADDSTDIQRKAMHAVLNQNDATADDSTDIQRKAIHVVLNQARRAEFFQDQKSVNNFAPRKPAFEKNDDERDYSNVLFKPKPPYKLKLKKEFQDAYRKAVLT